jgi:Putative auto-transporter adhesin, head GIN domain
MNKRLVSIAVVSLSVSAACGVLAVWGSATGSLGDAQSLAAAARSCAAMPWAKRAGSHGSAGQDDGARASGPSVDLEWRGSDAVKVNIPARVHYQPGPTAQASVSGDAELVGHVRMRDGTLEWDKMEWDRIVDCFPADDLVVRLTGPAVTAWTLNGSGELDLSDIKQDALRITVHGSGAVTASGEAHEASLDVAGSGRADLSRLVTQQTNAHIRGNAEVDLSDIKQDVLDITLHGSGTVTASGEAHEVSLDVAGSGRADLGRLVTQQANAHIRGSAEVDLAPRQDADVSIAGSAVVRLHGAVAQIHSHLSGSGQIKRVP